MDTETGYTERDLARIALAQQAARLADRLHGLVAGHGHDVEAGAWLGRLVSPALDEAEQLRLLTIGYERSLGASWDHIGTAVGLSADEAQRRWAVQVDRTASAALSVSGQAPRQAATELDEWFIRHLWLDPTMAAVPNPFSRQLDGPGGPVPSSCLICRKYEGNMVPGWAGTANPPGGHLIDDELWRVGHGPVVFSPAGTLLVESRRHILDYSEMNEAESTSYGALIGRLFPVIRAVTGAERIHVFSNMDGAPHFHAWLFPRLPTDVRGRRFVGNLGTCTTREATDLIKAMRDHLAKDSE